MNVFKLEIDQFTDGVKVSAFATKKEASAGGNSGVIVASAADLANAVQLTGTLLATIHNSLADSPVKRFPDRETACTRTWEVLSAKLAPKVVPVVKEANLKKKAPKGPPKEKKASKVAAKPVQRKGTLRDLPLQLVEGKGNRYRVGTISHRAFELVVANPTLSFREVVALGAKAGVISEMLREGVVSIKKNP